MKHIIVTCCGDCPYGQSAYCLRIDDFIEDRDKIHEKCDLQDYDEEG